MNGNKRLRLVLLDAQDGVACALPTGLRSPGITLKVVIPFRFFALHSGSDFTCKVFRTSIQFDPISGVSRDYVNSFNAIISALNFITTDGQIYGEMIGIALGKLRTFETYDAYLERKIAEYNSKFPAEPLELGKARHHLTRPGTLGARVKRLSKKVGYLAKQERFFQTEELKLLLKEILMCMYPAGSGDLETLNQVVDKIPDMSVLLR